MILEIILGFICIVFFFVIINLTKKVEMLEDNSSFYESYINMFDERINTVSQRLKQIDNRGTFESDDEVGFFFTYVKELQEDIKKLIGQIGDNDEPDERVNSKSEG